jgi:gas vesicle protein
MNSQEFLEELKKLDFMELVDIYLEAKTGLHHALYECPLDIVSKVKELEDLFKTGINVPVEDSVKSLEDMCKTIEDKGELYKTVASEKYEELIRQIEDIGNDHIKKLKKMMDTTYKDNEERKKEIMDFIKRVEMAMKKARNWG